MRVMVDTNKCICVGRCVEEAPDVFAQNEDSGIVVLLEEFPSSDEEAAVRKAAQACPVLAIEFTAN